MGNDRTSELEVELGSAFAGTRVLITGDTGFSGVWLSTLLSTLGAEVLGFSRDETSYSTLFPIDKGGNWDTCFGDIVDTQLVREQIRGFKPDLVFHLAAQSLVSIGYVNPLETYRTNSMGTASVLDACLGQPDLKGIIVITTDKVYKEGPELNTETSLLQGNDPYSSSKVCAEHIVLGFRKLFEDSGIAIAVARGGNVIGGGDWAKTRIVPDLVRSFLNSEPLYLRFPNSSRPWQHVLDLVNAYALLGEKILKGQGWEVDSEFNVGPRSGREYSVLDLVNEFQASGMPVEISIQSSKFHEADKLQISSLKSETTLNWSPKLDFSSAVHLTSEWYEVVSQRGEDAFEVTKSQVKDFLSMENCK